MKPLPCKDCICFAVCNSKVQQFNGVYKTQFIIIKIGNCSLFSDWLYQHPKPYHYDISRQQLKLFCECFNLKYDVKPDYNLLRHLDRHTINGVSELKYKRI